MDREKFIQKENELNQTKINLKEEFFGIDGTIDQFINSVGTWYHFSEIQSRPMVINLWGLTGVGKSELVRQTVKILGLEKTFYQFDCGEMYQPRTVGLREILSKISNYGERIPAVIFLDEFQMSRSIDEEEKERTQTGSRILWKLMDDGKIDFDEVINLQEERFFEIYDEYRFWINSGLKIENGLVDPSCKSFLAERVKWELFNDDSLDNLISKDSYRFVLPTGDLKLIYGFVKHKYRSLYHFVSFLQTVDELAFWDFMNECMEIFVKPKTIDLSQALIIVAGNLDEAYDFSRNQSSDISPDDFHKESLKIQLPDIKRALQRRFREEQIGRLGNNHLIFPCLNSEAYRAVIRRELRTMTDQVSGMFQIQLDFDETIVQWLFDEGVFPTQGVRPLISSIKYSIGDLIPKFMKSYFESGKEISEIRVSIGSELQVQFLKKEIEVYSMGFPIQSKIKNLKKSRGDDFQSLVAVHESGHAIIQIALTGIVPEKILSVSADRSIGGLTQKGLERKFYSRQLLKEKVSILLGGFYAEMEVFGEEHVSDGSTYDIKRASALTLSLFKESGFTNSLLKYASSDHERSHSFHQIKDVEKEAAEFIEKAGIEVKEILKREKKLLIEMAKNLSESSSIGSVQIQWLVKEFGSKSLKMNMNKKDSSYREMLFKIVS